jgi:protein-histidine N-methyltransferase
MDEPGPVLSLGLDAAAYGAWAKSMVGIELMKELSIRDLPGGERGIYCEEDIEPNSTIFSIPFSSLLTIKSAFGTPLESVPSYWREDDVLAVLLLYEKYHRKEASFWHPHILCIPAEYHSIINFSDDELEMIEGSNLYTIATAWKVQVRQDFANIITQIPQLFNVDTSWLTFDSYLWALCTIWSRFVTVDKDGRQYRCMVPYFDLLNHNPSSTVGHIFLGDKICLCTQQKHTRGDELSLNYGPQSNTKLMMIYGFCIPPCAGNPHNSVDIFTAMHSAASLYSEKTHILSSLGIHSDKEPFKLTECTDSHCGVPRDLVTCLRVQYGDVGDPSLGVADLARAREGPLSDASEQYVCSVLLTALDGMIDGYATTLEDDEESLLEWGLLSGCVVGSTRGGSVGTSTRSAEEEAFVPPSEREKNAVMMRYSEKVVLRSVLNWVEEHATNLSDDK